MAEELQTCLLEHFQWLHRHPELALKEYETTNYVKNVLKQTEGVELLNLGLDTGVLAKIEGKEPGGVVAIRADIDALPILEESGLSYSSENDGCMHACGHDFHTTALLGVAKLLGGEREHIKGTVILLFQPAEEAEHGGEKVVNTGMFEKYKIEKIFGLHTKHASRNDCNCTRSIFSGGRPVLIYGKRNGMPRKRPADGSGSDPGSSKTGRKSSGNCKPKNQSDGDGSYQRDSFYIRHKLEHYPRDRQARRNRSHI